MSSAFCNEPKLPDFLSTSATFLKIPLRGPSGERVDFTRTIRSHGCARLPPALHRADTVQYEIVLRLGEQRVLVSLTEERNVLIVRTSERLVRKDAESLRKIVRRIFRLDEDFSAFYNALSSDPEIAWACAGAGRFLCSPTVFEDVVKTICTTNCAWSGTERMVGALVSGLGAGGFPTPDEMAGAPLRFYTGVARAGYRATSLRELAAAVSAGRLDLERLRPRFGYSDDEVEGRLLAIHGVGPYACAHIMMLLGRYRRLVLDSWTRPTFLRLSGKRRCTDRAIEQRFKRYGEFAGLAFWLYITRDWLDEPSPTVVG